MTASATFDPDLTVVRRTFLYRHVAAQLAQTADVLAVDGIRRRVEPLLPEDDGETRCRLASVLRLDHFFERHHRTLPPDAQVYFPLSVRPTDGAGSGAADLTALLRQLDAVGDRRGVVLTTRSGAGKTVAARKAFFDCVFPTADSPRPPLADFLPCWLDLTAAVGKDSALERIRGRYQHGDGLAILQQRTVDDAVVLELIQQASGWPGIGPERVRDWVTFGPKLLLFADLNAADEATRTVAARALAHFQARWGSAGHRVVVAYRTTQPDDATIRGPEFRDYTLDPIGRAQALAYLRNVRDFEQAVFEQLRRALPGRTGLLTTPDRDIDAEVAKLAELIDRYDRYARWNEEGVVCTPLLMHLMSQLEYDQDDENRSLDKLRSLTDLYDRVVDHHLLYDEEHYGTTRTPALPASLRREEGRARRKTAMTRVALMMHARRVKSLPVTDVTEAWKDPATGAPGMIGATYEPWQAPDTHDFSWTASPYFTEPFPPTEHVPLMQYGFLRRVGESLRFLHDSFIDYFLGGVALARPHNAEAKPWKQGIRPAWFPAVATRMHSAPERFQNAALFLAGALNPVLLRELLLHLIPAEPKNGLPAAVGSLIRGRPLEADTVLDTLARTLRVPTIYGRPETLFHQCHDDLEWPYLDQDAVVCRRVAEQFRLRMRRPWLRYRSRGRRHPELILRGHNGEVSSVVELPDERLASGGDDGTVRVWDLAGGEPLELDGRGGLLTALDDGRIVTASRDCTIRVWDLVGGDPLVLKGHWGRITAWALLGDGRIALGGGDGTVLVWDLAGGTPLALESHPEWEEAWGGVWEGGWIGALAALPGGRLASGDSDGQVRVWDLAGGPPLVLEEHRGDVRSIAVLDEDRIASGSSDGTIRVWDLGGGPPRVLKAGFGTMVQSLAVLDDGRIASGYSDGKLRVWDLVGGEPLVLETHGGGTRVVPLDDGRIAASGDDGTIYVWDLAANASLELKGHWGRVSAVVPLRDGRIASGSTDRTVRVWDPGVDAPLVVEDEWQAIDDKGDRVWIYSLAALECGRVASVWSDGVVRVSDSAGGAPVVMEILRGWVRSVAAAGVGRLALGGKDGTVRVWDPASGETTVLEGHRDWVQSVAVLDGGRVVAGGDNTVRVWDLRGGEPSVLRGQCAVRSVAALGSGRIASGWSDGTVRVWDPASGEQIVLQGHRGDVISVAALDGGRVVSGGDNTVRVWDPASGERIVLEGHRGKVNSVAALGDGRVVSGGDDGTARVWAIDRREAVMILEADDAVRALCTLTAPPRIVMGLANGRVLFVDLVEPRP